MGSAERIKVMVADDEESVRDVLQVLLASEPELVAPRRTPRPRSCR